VDDEVAIVRWAFRPQRVVRDDYLLERYRFPGEGIPNLCGKLGPKIQQRTARSHAMTVPQMVCVALRFFFFQASRLST